MSGGGTPQSAIVLSAGLGLRMRPLTLTTPKPLIEVAGRSMLDRALDKLTEAGITRQVVNLHHLPAVMRAHLAARPDVLLSDETDFLLETGGGVRRALPLLGDGPFYAINGDMVWTDKTVPALRRLADAWDPARMDALLLLTPTATAFGYGGKGDFSLTDDTPVRRGAALEAPYVFAGLQILTPALFANTPEGAWSLNLVYDRAAASNRLVAVVHDGGWYHVGTPDAVAPASALVAADEQERRETR